MKSCHDCKYYHAEYGGVCFAQKDAPRVGVTLVPTEDGSITMVRTTVYENK